MQVRATVVGKLRALFCLAPISPSLSLSISLSLSHAHTISHAHTLAGIHSAHASNTHYTSHTSSTRTKVERWRKDKEGEGG
jgi:hypothetical protein